MKTSFQLICLYSMPAFPNQGYVGDDGKTAFLIYVLHIDKQLNNILIMALMSFTFLFYVKILTG